MPESSPDPACGHLERGSSGSTADFAVEGRPELSERSPDTPYARRVAPLADGEIRYQLAAKRAEVGHRDAKLDEAIEESFPASDPPSFQPRHD